MIESTKPSPQAMSVVRLPELETRLGLSKSTIYERTNPNSPRYDESFPKPIRLGLGAAVGWLEHEVDAWLRRRMDAREEVLA